MVGWVSDRVCSSIIVRCTINNSFVFTNHLRQRECPVPGIELNFLDDDLFSASICTFNFMDISVADPEQRFHENPMMLGKTFVGWVGSATIDLLYGFGSGSTFVNISLTCY